MSHRNEIISRTKDMDVLHFSTDFIGSEHFSYFLGKGV